VHKTKTIAALAVASAFAAPAMAQVPAGVQLYGRLNVGLDTYEAKGAALGSQFNYNSRLRVFDTASRVGLRGTEDLGNGLRAIFQIETGANVDSGNANGQNGITNPNTGFWASRDSWAGLESDKLGRLTFGRQSVYWSNGTIEQIGANYINASSPFSTYSQSGIVVGPVARESNTVQYSARIGGFSATASYGLSATSFQGTSQYEAAQSQAQNPGIPGFKPRDQFYALTLRYNHSVFDLQADWAQRSDVVNIKGRDAIGWKLGAAWKYMPGSQISVVYQNLKDEQVFGLGVASGIALPCTTPNAFLVPTSAGNIPAALFRTTGGGGTVNGCDTLKQDMWVVSWEQTFGNFQALAQYGWASNVSGSSTAGGLPNSGAQSYLLGGRYFLSKRTWLYASWNKISNKTNSYSDYWGGWMTSANQLGAAPGLPSTSSGADPQIIAVGFFHTF
jgi:predicted porin